MKRHIREHTYYRSINYVVVFEFPSARKHGAEVRGLCGDGAGETYVNPQLHESPDELREQSFKNKRCVKC